MPGAAGQPSSGSDSDPVGSDASLPGGLAVKGSCDKPREKIAKSVHSNGRIERICFQSSEAQQKPCDEYNNIVGMHGCEENRGGDHRASIP